MDRRDSIKQRGFTLIELLIVMGMLGVVMAAIYSLYITHQRAAYMEDEVVEVQQNLRIAMDSITRDVRMAGFMVSRNGFTPIKAELTSNATGTPQLLPAPNNINSDVLTVNVISTFGTYARLDPPPDETVTYSGEAVSFPVDSPDSVDMFKIGDTVRIVRTSDRTEPLSTLFTVSGPPDRNAVPRPTIPLTGELSATTVYQRGDIIAKVSASDTINPPSTITYCLGPSDTCGKDVQGCPAGQLCLMRIENMTGDSMGTAANLIAANLAGLQFRYLMDDGTEVPTPPDSPLPAADNFSKIRSVRVLIIGQTSVTKKLVNGQPKVRQVESVIQLRNR